MSEKKYEISKGAKNDLVSIWDYTEETWSKAQADNYVRNIFDEIKFIADNITTGRPLLLGQTQYRIKSTKSHLIIYKLREEGTLDIIRILHEHMDIPSRLK